MNSKLITSRPMQTVPSLKQRCRMPEWDRFKFEIARQGANELTTVRHVVHVPFARRIAITSALHHAAL